MKRQEKMKQMKHQELSSMSIDELWSLREAATSELSLKIRSEKERLNQRLRRLSLSASSSGRRAYPPVSAKYVNPAHPDETWSGRGRQPRWLAAQLRFGRRLEDFRIQPN
jgi:DNA-binding protein H-NS